MKKLLLIALVIVMCVSVLPVAASAEVSMGGKIEPKTDDVVIIDPEDTPTGAPCEIVAILGKDVDLSSVISVDMEGMVVHSLAYLQYKEGLDGTVDITFIVPGIEVGEKLSIATYLDGEWGVANGVSTVPGEVTLSLSTEWHCVAFVVEAPQQGGGEDSPKTGVTTFVALAACVFVVCAAGAVFAFKRSKKS